MPIIYPRRYYGTVLPLDFLSTATAAYGLRRLRTGYSGNCIKIRRSSDNTDLDIGFSGNNIDISALLTFVGAGNGTIRIWYDQSGNGNNAIIGAVSAPQLVTSGAIENINGRPAALFSASQGLAVSGLTLAQPFTEYAVVSPSSTGTKIVLGNTSGDQALYTESSVVKLRANGQAIFSTKVPVGTNVGNVLSGVMNGSSSLVSSNGGYLTGTNLGTAGISGLELGTWQGGGLGFSGKIAEAIIYPTAHSIATRGTIEDLTMSWFGVAPMGTYIFDGDSLTAGVGSSGGNTYPAQFIASIPGVNFSINDGVGGATLINMNNDAPSTIDNQIYALRAPTYLMIWGGTNDMYVTGGGYTPAQTYDHLKTYIAARRATGKYTKIVVLTSIPREDPSNNTADRFAYNDLIRAGMQPGGDLLAIGADILCDLQTLSMFNSAADASDTTYYDADKVHLNNTGYAQVAAKLKLTLGL